MTTTQQRAGGLEVRSIDYVPLSERHGKVWHLGPLWLWVVILTVVARVVALVGYDLIHRAEQWLTYLMIVIFGIFTITLFVVHYPAGTFDIGTFRAGPFLAQFGVVAGYQISWAI